MSLKQSILQGALRFAGISLAAYAVWAFGGALKTMPLYLSITAVFLVLSGVLLRPLVGSECKPGRFYVVFTGAFLAYALLWCLGWFGIKGHAGEIFGSAAGLAACTWILLRGAGSGSGSGSGSDTSAFLPCWAVVFLFHTLGYVAGGVAYSAAGASETIAPALARLTWGLGHGLGFGAGLGYVLYHCRDHQAPGDTK